MIEIKIPPLRERPDDIIPLISHYIDKYDKKHGCRVYFSKEFLDTLLSYPGPEHVKELFHVIERLVVIMPDEIIQPHHLSYLVQCGTNDISSKYSSAASKEKNVPLGRCS